MYYDIIPYGFAPEYEVGEEPSNAIVLENQQSWIPAKFKNRMIVLPHNRIEVQSVDRFCTLIQLRIEMLKITSPFKHKKGSIVFAIKDQTEFPLSMGHWFCYTNFSAIYFNKEIAIEAGDTAPGFFKLFNMNVQTFLNEEKLCELLK